MSKAVKRQRKLAKVLDGMGFHKSADQVRNFARNLENRYRSRVKNGKKA